ncbi:hypothetical protein LUZ63_008863 [Rhynchospora breviuscula]|uniref:DUF7036 domain-containing protein n=1 Tax=Rhynchospora breviuscula TaxID=2022672 RepID=A0A9Q0CEA9_9POAL|nr:hypothetical protein LUZ63_008863 [Rhynchospora breviuscula]
MGKDEEDQAPGSGDAAAASSSETGWDSVRTCGKRVTWRCAAALLFGVAVLLSALFWLPPFDTWHHRSVGPGSDDTIGADIVASFRLQRTVAELKENISRLEYDIYAEVGSPGTIVSVSSLEPVNGSSYTTVVFSIWPYPKDSTISPTWISIIRSSFMSLVVRQSTLQLTEPLFGNSSFFEVLRFPGGITVIPPQSAFLLQRPHAFFNFTLNFPIYKVQDKVEELKEQMKQGLYLNSYENLFVKLTNLEGSTVNPPTIVQTSIVLEVGNHQPSQPRLRQLAQTITNSSSQSNLGLNHTTFGRVKQISLSSYLRHSLTNGPYAPGPYAASPSPLPHSHHHHHHKNHKSPPDPVHAPAPAPKPESPTGCRFQGYQGNNVTGKHAAAPVAHPPANKASPPGKEVAAPAPSATATGASAAAPLSGVSFEHVNPPSESERNEKGYSWNTSPSPSPQPNSCRSSHQLRIGWLIAPVLYLLLLVLQ